MWWLCLVQVVIFSRNFLEIWGKKINIKCLWPPRYKSASTKIEYKLFKIGKLYIKNYKSHKKSSFPDILICVDLALKMGNQQDSTAHRWYSCACKILTICCLNVNNVILAKLKCGDMTILHREHHHENWRNGLFPWGICGKIEHTQPISRNTPYLDPPL